LSVATCERERVGELDHREFRKPTSMATITTPLAMPAIDQKRVLRERGMAVPDGWCVAMRFF